MATEDTRPLAVRTAASRVRQQFPEVVQVFFTVEGRWLYLDSDLDAPAFWDRVDVGILEDAADAAEADKGLPCAYFIGDL